ncbi:MAG: glutamate-5-semialdehyde dehydrogenase [Eubacterium sp.]|nr:glutamate-5-semialdehyde dehydrogenase [Eubacterium sp.]
MSELQEMGKKAKAASFEMGRLGSKEKNDALLRIADALVAHTGEILKGNKVDLEHGEENGMSPALMDRLRLTEARIEGIAKGVRQVAALDDPIGEILSMKRRPNGLMIGQMRVPMGVIGIIFESRPNVTVDSFALTFKAGNAVILRGGSDCIHSNMVLVRVIRDTLREAGVPEDSVQLVENTDRAIATELMRMNRYVDVLIPRGGAGLIRSVVENATVPVIETGTGNCHIYIDETADPDMAVRIVRNAKLQRLGVCNAAESLVIHKAIADDVLPLIAADLAEDGCEIRGDEVAQEISNLVIPATEEDYGREYLDKIISAKIVENVDEAIAHINKYSTGHSESILTKDYANAQKFLREVDSACVYVNASTRFSDGFEFGFGAEIGISTQKLHARGPMGLLALTTTKFIIYGDGQVRP